jgi:hypothetical protein
MDVVDETELALALREGVVLDRAQARLDADLLRRFCVHRPGDVDPRGIRLSGVIITGPLDLTGVEVPFPLRFDRCEFEHAPILHGAKVKELAITGCARLPGLLANGISVQGDVELSRTQVVGSHPTSASTSRKAAIWLCESEIGGRLLCVDTTITPDKGERSIQADRMRVGGTVRFLHNFHACGEMRLVGAQIIGSLDLTGAWIESDGLALDLGDASVNGNVFLVTSPAGRQPRIKGRIDMSSMRVDGEFLIRNAALAKSATNEGTHHSKVRFHGKALTASRLTVGAEISIEGQTTIIGGVDFSSSELGGLSIERGCQITAPGEIAIDLTNAEVRSDVQVSEGVHIRGTLLMVGARLRGRLHLDGVVLSDPAGRSLIKADGASVDGNVDIQRVRASGGQLKFWRSQLGGGLDATGAVVDNPAGATVRLHQANVRGSVRLVNGFTSHGCVLLNRSTSEGRLDLAGASFDCPGPGEMNGEGSAIQAISATFRGGMDLAWRSINPAIDLTDTTTTVVQDDPENWPGRIYVSGFTYDRFDAPRSGSTGPVWDWRRRHAWLTRQAEYDAGPFEQAARVFRQHGYTYGAEQLLIAQRTQARKAADGPWSRSRSVLDAVYGWTVGYGYRPTRVLWLLGLLLILVTASLITPAVQGTLRASSEGDVFTTTGQLIEADGPIQPLHDPCGDGRVRCFHPVLYALDSVVPLIDLDQRATWYPSPYSPWGGVVEWWLSLAAVAGWILSSIFLLSFARLARNT